MCALDGYLYAFGGWVGEDIGGTIERYDPLKDQWEYLTKMQEPRFSMGICVYDKLIYLVGGCTHSRRHMQELVSYNPVSLLIGSGNFDREPPVARSFKFENSPSSWDFSFHALT